MEYLGGAPDPQYSTLQHSITPIASWLAAGCWTLIGNTQFVQKGPRHDH